MRSQNKKTARKVILETDFLERGGENFLKKYIYLIKRKLSSVDSAMILSEFYDEEFATDSIAAVNEVNDIFGPTLYRESENIEEYTSYDNMLDDYLRFDIYKFFGLNLDAYLNLTLYEKNKIIKKAIKHIEELQAAMADVSKDINKSTTNIANEIEQFTM